MTDAQIKQWKVERDIARAIKDEEERKKALEKVYDHRDDLQMECIQHQADRIKTCLAKSTNIEAEITELKNATTNQQVQINKCLETDGEFRRMKECGKGVALGVKIAIAVGSVIGFEALKGLVTALGNIIK